MTSYAFGWFALFPDEFKAFSKHIAGGASFVSNFVLWQESGYFDSAAETKPLLHLWSLGVEEQFYIIYPLLIGLAWKRKFNLFNITILITVISFCLNMKEIHHHAAATFFLPQTRLWELMCGSLLAWLTLYHKETFLNYKNTLEKWFGGAIHRLPKEPDKKIVANVISILGFFLLFYGFIHIDKELSFPGKWALIPVLGSVLIIAAGQQAWLNQVILSNRIAVWFGLISFPLYLWHWIFLSFARVMESETPSRAFRFAFIGLSIFLAWITYRFVERPFRSSHGSHFKVVFLVFLMGIIFTAGIVTKSHESWNALQPANLAANHLIIADDAVNHKKCMEKYGLTGYIRYCNISSNQNPAIALIGDSHAAVLYAGLSELLTQENEGLLSIGGRLFLDVATYPRGVDSEIAVYKGGIRATKFVAHEPSISTVVMASRGPFYISGDWIYNLISDPTISDRKKIWEVGMRKTLDSMMRAKKKVIFVVDNPEIDFEPHKCMERPLRLTRKPPSVCSIPRAQFDSRNKDYRDLVFRVLNDYPMVSVFDAAAYLCDKHVCSAKINGKVLYRDYDHLSLDGSRFMAKELIKVLHGQKGKLLV